MLRWNCRRARIDASEPSFTLQNVAWADFEEKEYEIAFTVELSTGSGGRRSVFSCGQVLEHILGYDAASNPDRGHIIWQVLDVPRPPSLRLLPAHWAGGPRPTAERLPDSPVSLILQYKRPEYLFGPTAKQWRHWKRPYFRFTITRDQQQVLRRLERRVGDQALVRYAAPAFWRRADLETAMLDGSVVQRTGFTRPAFVAGHRAWTYVRPGQQGRANPRGTRHPVEDFATLLQGAGDLPQALTSRHTESRIEDHILALGEAASDREPQLRGDVGDWLTALEEADLPLQPDRIELLGAYASVLTLVDAIGASWLVVG